MKGTIRLAYWASSTLCRSSCFEFVKFASQPIGKGPWDLANLDLVARARFGPLPSVSYAGSEAVRRSPLSATTGRSYTGR